MELKVIKSNSSGNCYILETDTEALIIEAGVKFSEVKKAINFKVSKVVACLISHEHKDHAGKVNEFLSQAVPIYMTAGTAEKTEITGHRKPNICRAGQLFKVGNFRIIPFETMHDSEEPVGFYINHPTSGNILFATDTYYLPSTFAGLNNILIECNYSEEIMNRNIEAGKIPRVVRNRTLKSHMSYENCIKALQANNLTEVNNIVLIHLSDNNSHAQEFKEGIKSATGKTVHIATAGLQINFCKTPF